ncbi:hypothetical protein [Cohnella sp. GCM10027633]|uniref:hypothetical protein n=1 Tax=unclassified Cohnella TaxID=2636738 RepID=UPI003642BAD2
MSDPESKEEKKMAATELIRKPAVNLKTKEQLENFIDVAKSKNPMTESTKQRLKNRTPTPRGKR